MSEAASENGDAAQAPSNASLFGESQPENAPAQVVTASEHAAATTHPFFAGRGRGRGRGRGGGGGGRRGGASESASGNATTGATTGAAIGANRTGGNAGSANATTPVVNSTALIVPDDDRQLFGPISLRELEFAQRKNADGAESSVFSDDDDDELFSKKKKKKKRKKSASTRRHGVARRKLTDEEAMAAAAFGGGSSERGGEEGEEGEEGDDGEDDDGEEGEDGEDGEEGEEGEEEGNSTIGGPRLLPIRGESCAGCILDRSVIEPVDKFVRQNAVCMTETALYKAAALFYKNEVIIPRRREGVKVLPWKWKDIQSHYVLHACDPLLQRAAAVRSLGAVRAVQEQSLMRLNSDGTKQLDHKGAELLLKIVALQDKQLQALDAMRMPPPAARGR